MIVLILGLVIFLGIHSVRIVGEGWRSDMIRRLGDGPWKGVYSLASVVGLVLIVWGYGLSRVDPVTLWNPPIWTRHLAILLNFFAFVLFAAYLLPAGKIKAMLGHPMLLSVKIWAVAHLIANGTLADVVLFGSFLAWAVVDFRAARERDRMAGTVRIAGPPRNDVLAVLVGAVIWAALLWRVHAWITGGVSPLA